MKLDGWVEKIIGNVAKNTKIINNEVVVYGVSKIIKENLKAFVQDFEVVKVGIGESNQLYVYVIE